MRLETSVSRSNAVKPLMDTELFFFCGPHLPGGAATHPLARPCGRLAGMILRHCRFAPARRPRLAVQSQPWAATRMGGAGLYAAFRMFHHQRVVFAYHER